MFNVIGTDQAGQRSHLAHRSRYEDAFELAVEWFRVARYLSEVEVKHCDEDKARVQFVRVG